MEVHVVAWRDTDMGFIRALKHLHSPEPKWKHTQSITDFLTLFSCQDQTLKGATKRKCRYWNWEGQKLTKWGWKEPCWSGQHFWRLMMGAEVVAIPWRYLCTSQTLLAVFMIQFSLLPYSFLTSNCLLVLLLHPMAFHIELHPQLIPDYMSSTDIKTLVISEFSQALTLMRKDTHIFKPFLYLWLYAYDKHSYKPNTTVSYKDDEWGLWVPVKL